MNIPAQIGRFNIIKELGRGSQGVVYLAEDPRLERQVAIKTLHLHLPEDGEKAKRLMQEARTVSKLQHPNIIPVYEAGEFQQRPYLVFEYVSGISLRDLLKKEGRLVVHRAISVMKQVLEGIAYAHQQGVVHRDMSPANILIGDNEVPRIMDFGISIVAGPKTAEEMDISGTPCYMSPEHFSKEPLGPYSDIFALGLIFYELLVGAPAIEAENHFTAMYKIANETIDLPSLKNDTVDKELDRIIAKALEKGIASRYADAMEMKEDLEEYLKVNEGDGDDGKPAKDSHSTLDFLLRKIRHKSDFPSFSRHIIEINKRASVSRANYASASELSNAILKDHALTNKLLKLVNSAFYGQFAGKITTISRAVVVLGFEQVSVAASSLMLFEHLKNKGQSMDLQDAALSSFMSGMIAEDLAGKAGLKGKEEAFICSMLHNLGRHLVLFYFPEEFEQIKTMMAQKGIGENKAVRAVLGIDYEELGSGVAKSWHFPERIVRAMKPVSKGKVEKPGTEEDKLCHLSGFSNELCAIIGQEAGEREKALKKLLERYEKSFSIPRKQIVGLLDTAKERVEEYSDILNINMKRSRFLNQVTSYSTHQERAVQAAEAKVESPEEEEIFNPDNTQAIEIHESPSESEDSKDPQSILINGIQEITNTLLEDFELNDVLNMILETMYRGFSFNRVLFCIMTHKRSRISARFGFGKDVERIIEKFQFKVGGTSDVFNLALTQAKDLGIDYSRDPRIQRGIPKWYLKHVPSAAFVLYPIIVNKVPLAMIYADREKEGPVLKGNQLNYMKTLCNQAVLAMKQMAT